MSLCRSCSCRLIVWVETIAFFPCSMGEKHGRHEVSERFAYASAGFDDEMTLFFKRLRNRRRHRLLLRAIFEIARLCEEAVFGENCPHPLDKIAAKGIFERNHTASLRGKSEIRISKSETIRMRTNQNSKPPVSHEEVLDIRISIFPR